ncbi:hypothetical protein DSUL_20551 [Desulfovibrionales bacterium]
MSWKGYSTVYDESHPKYFFKKFDSRQWLNKYHIQRQDSHIADQKKVSGQHLSPKVCLMPRLY